MCWSGLAWVAAAVAVSVGLAVGLGVAGLAGAAAPRCAALRRQGRPWRRRAACLQPRHGRRWAGGPPFVWQ
eukprot:1151693-Pelagomonas_calceolata.AAC.7